MWLVIPSDMDDDRAATSQLGVWVQKINEGTNYSRWTIINNVPRAKTFQISPTLKNHAADNGETDGYGFQCAIPLIDYQPAIPLLWLDIRTSCLQPDKTESLVEIVTNERQTAIVYIDLVVTGSDAHNSRKASWDVDSPIK